MFNYAFALTLFALVTGGIWYAEYDKPSGNTLTVSFLDVGQGDATFIEAPNGTQVLIDGGSGGSITRALSDVMPFFDRSIDMVIATHPDEDHIGGLPEVLKRFQVDQFLEPGVPDNNATLDTILRYIVVEEVEHVIARRGQRLWLDEEKGVYLQVLFPDRDVSEVTDANDGSIVIRLVYGETEFLFTADAPKGIENYVVWLDSESVQADVLKVGHHGSRTSTDEYFVGWVDPQYAVISAGCDNRYGHPHQEVIANLTKYTVEILETCTEGTIVFESTGTQSSLRRQ